MALSLVELQANELARQITINVKIAGFRGWLIRLWIARQFLKLAAWISGMGIEIEEQNARKNT